MKYIKYLLLGLAVSLLSTSCEKRTVEFDWFEASSRASYQVWNMNLMANSSANYVKYLTVNGTTYTNNHSSILSPYNFAPSGTAGVYYTIEPCSKMEIVMDVESSTPQYDEYGAPIKNWDESGDSIIYERSNAYKGTVEHNFQANKIYYVVVDDYAKDPMVIEESGIPVLDTDAVDSLNWGSNKAGLRLFNFFHSGNPNGKIKYYAKFASKDDYKANPRFETDWIAYGESTDWYLMDVYRTDPNSSGYEVIYCDIAYSEDNGATEEIIVKNDYWTTYIGRSYYYSVVGDMAKEVKSPEIKRFSAM